MKRSIIFAFSILSTLTLITSCHRFDFEFDSRHSAPEVVDVMFTITNTFSEYVKYDLDIQFNQAYSEDFKIAVQHSYSTDTYINESGNNKLTISVEINKDDFEQNEDGIFVYHVAISALDKYGTPIGQVYDLELTYEHVDAILLDTTFNTALNDALDGYTELKFVANSAYRAQTTPLFTDKNGTKAYAIKNGSCLEVHTLANLFVAPADCSRMFHDLYNLTTIEFNDCFDTSKVTDMSCMFWCCESLTSLDLSNFNTSQVTDMSAMFINCESLTSLDLSNFDTSQVTDMSAMFYYCESLTSLDLSNFDTSQVTDMSAMFYYCESLTSLDLSNFDTSQVTNMSWMFAYCNTLSELDISSFSFSQEPDITHMFIDMGLSLGQATIPVYVSQAGYDYITTSGHTYCDSDDKVVLFIDKEDTGAVDCVYLPDGWIFNNIITEALGSSTELKFVANSQTTSNTVLFTDDYDTKAYAVMSGSCLEVHTTANRFFAPDDCFSMFYDLYNLTTIEFNDCFDTSQVTDMSAMFYNCESLASLDLSNFDTSRVTDMEDMFYYCKSLTSLDLSNFNTSQVTDMGAMFSDCMSLTSLDLSNFDTSQVTNMCEMFACCNTLSELDISSFSFSQEPDITDMFVSMGSSLGQATVPVYVSQAGKEYLDAHYTSYTKAEFMVVN